MFDRRFPVRLGPVSTYVFILLFFQDNVVEYFKVDEGNDSADPIIEALFACTSCVDWKTNFLPTVTHRAIYAEMMADRSRAVDIQIAAEGVDAQEGNGMEITTDNAVCYVIDEEYELATYCEVVQITRATPKQLDLKVVKRRLLSWEMVLL